MREAVDSEGESWVEILQCWKAIGDNVKELAIRVMHVGKGLLWVGVASVM